MPQKQNNQAQKQNTGKDAPEAASPTYLQRLLARSRQEVDAPHTLGEVLAPYLLALVEALWVNGLLIGLASTRFLQTDTALLPFWGPPLLFCAAVWLFQRTLEDNEPAQARVGWFLGILALLNGVIIWARLYSSESFLLDPRWLLAFGNDLIQVNQRGLQTVVIVILTIYFSWRATHIGQRLVQPSQVWRQLWIGLAILLGAILLRAGLRQMQGSLDDVILVLLIPMFLYCVLSAHALARLSFVRRMHPTGLDGSAEGQERAVLSVIGGVGLAMLLLTLCGALFFSASFFDALQPAEQILAIAYNWLAQVIAWLITWISFPFMWLILWLASLNQSHKPPQLNANQFAPKGLPHSGQPVPTPGILIAAQIILPFLLLAIMLFVLWLALRRRKRLSARRNRTNNEIHESIWSWSLFWQQFKALLALLFGRKRPEEQAAISTPLEDLPAEPAARTLRQIYRALLRKAALHGFARQRDETPREFQQRLNSQFPRNHEPQLGQITDAYTLTRYGGAAPGEFDLNLSRAAWEQLSQKWDAE